MKKFFGAVDEGSVYPSWYFEYQLEGLKNDIRRNESTLKLGLVSDARRGEIVERLEQDKKRLEEIVDSIPKFSGDEKDKLAKIVKSTGDLISASMPTYSEMERGTADPHEEVKRNHDSCIKIDPELAEAANVKLDKKGFCSRNNAIKAWQIGRKLLEENTNSEVLRKDK